MFLAIDESEALPKKIIGGILLPLANLPDFEKSIVERRIRYKLFGEIKWDSIDEAYIDGYLDIINCFFVDSKATYHSMCYRSKRLKYKAAYVLIRTICWKLWNAGIREPLYILFDNDSNVGATETQIIRKLLNNDSKIKHKIEFCNQGVSHVLGVLQVTDVITGAVCFTVNKEVVSKSKNDVISYISDNNQKIPLDFALPYLPKLNELKIHFFDPDNKTR